MDWSFWKWLVIALLWFAQIGGLYSIVRFVQKMPEYWRTRVVSAWKQEFGGRRR